MHNEIEAQFLDINKSEIRQKLQTLGAELVHPEALMRRTVFDTGTHTFARVRDEGGKIVMTYKKILDGKSITGTKEINLTVDNYENAVEFLICCGLQAKAEQESYREAWKLFDCEICLDTWPWIPSFVEVEGPSAGSVWRAAEALGFSRSQAKFGSVDTTYQHYFGVDPDIVNNNTPKILFNIEPPSWVKPLS